MPATSVDRFGELRALLQSPPSAQVWASICALFEGWPEEDLSDRALPYASGHLSRWPQGLRVAPARWVARLARGEAVPAIGAVEQLCGVSLSLAEQEALLGGLAALPAHLSLISRAEERMWHRPARMASWSATLDASTAEVIPKDHEERTLAWWALGAHPSHTLRELTWRGAGLTAAALRAARQAPWWPHLTRLDLGSNLLSDEGVALLASLPLGSLRELSLRDNALSMQGLTCLRDAPWAPQLEALSLGHNAIGVDGMRVLGGVAWPELRRLEVGAARLSAQALSMLEGWDAPRLEVVDMTSNSWFSWALSDEEVASMWTPGALQQVRCWHLGRLSLGDERVQALAERWQGLDGLGLRGNDLRVGAVRALAQASGLLGLRWLDLSYNKLDDEGVEALSRAPWLSGLEGLSLAYVWSTAASLDQLAATCSVLALRHLELSYNALRDAGAQALADWSGLSQLESLSLVRCDIGPAGVEALSQSPHLRQLKRLDLRNNSVGVEGAHALARGRWDALEVLSLTGFDVSPEAVAILTAPSSGLGLMAREGLRRLQRSRMS